MFTVFFFLLTFENPITEQLEHLGKVRYRQNLIIHLNKFL